MTHSKVLIHTQTEHTR